MILACQKLLGQITKVLGLRRPPSPYVGKNSQIIAYFFLRASLTPLWPIWPQIYDNECDTGDDDEWDSADRLKQLTLIATSSVILRVRRPVPSLSSRLLICFCKSAVTRHQFLSTSSISEILLAHIFSSCWHLPLPSNDWVSQYLLLSHASATSCQWTSFHLGFLVFAVATQLIESRL